MLAYILAVLVGTGSVSLYIAAFFFPEIHRKHDFIWSGVGFFYALTLWIYAHQLTGGILLGQATSVILLGWFAWQTLKLRRQLVPVNQQTPMPDTTKLQAQLGLNRLAPKPAKPPVKVSVQPTRSIAPPAPKIPTDQPPVSQEPTPGETKVPERVRPTPPPVSPDPVAEAVDLDPADEEAWIKLEVKPAPTPAKPLGTAVKPPPSISTDRDSEPPHSSAVSPEPISTDVPTDTIQTTVKLD
jgi:Ycf66 protein N-terminus